MRDPDRPHEAEPETDAEALALLSDLAEELLPGLLERGLWRRAIERARRLRQAILLGEVLVLSEGDQHP